MAHEIVHSINKSGEKGVVIKLDYEKAYDRVSWPFLFDMLLETFIRFLLIGSNN